MHRQLLCDEIVMLLVNSTPRSLSSSHKVSIERADIAYILWNSNRVKFSRITFEFEFFRNSPRRFQCPKRTFKDNIVLLIGQHLANTFSDCARKFHSHLYCLTL